SCRSFFFFSSRRRHTRLQGDWSSDVCSSDLVPQLAAALGWDLAGELVERGCELWNVYGPTETAVWSALRRVGGDGHLDGAVTGEIGRASCRERVGAGEGGGAASREQCGAAVV